MNENVLSRVGQLSDQQLVAHVTVLAQRERRATAALIAHLTVLDERGLYLAEGFSSMFTYCLQVLHLSEHAAYGRIEAARAARKYPIILELLDDGSINLTTVTLLAPHLTPENHAELLVAAKHQRKRQVEELLAALRPQPSVPSSIRRLPAPHPAPAAAATVSGDLRLDSGDEMPLSTVPTPARPAVIAPLAPERYKVQFTASAATHAKLMQTQDLLRSQIPNGDVGEIIDRALTALLKELTRQKFAATDRPHKSTERPRESGHDTDHRSRHIPAEVRRTVWTRDGGRCAFVGPNGRRCEDRASLEFHHLVPYGAGGEATVENIELRCRAHNSYEAELYFGRRTYLRRITNANSSIVTNATRSGPSKILVPAQPP